MWVKQALLYVVFFSSYVIGLSLFFQRGPSADTCPLFAANLYSLVAPAPPSLSSAAWGVNAQARRPLGRGR